MPCIEVITQGWVLFDNRGLYHFIAMLNLSLYILPFENMIKGSSYMQEENLPYTSVFPVYQVSILLVICFNIYHNDLPLF
jgi:hypothetical protein